MPHFYQFYEDYIKNENRFNIKRAVSQLKIPHLIIHGNGDTSVSIEEAKNIHRWNPESLLEIIADANHVFGASHPWNKDYLPDHLNHVINLCIGFLN